MNVRGHQRSSEVLRGPQRSSEVLRGPQRGPQRSSVNQMSSTCPPHRLSSKIYARYSSVGLPSVATSHRTGSDRTDCTTVCRNSCVDDHGLRRKLTAWNRQLLSSGCETGGVEERCGGRESVVRSAPRLVRGRGGEIYGGDRRAHAGAWARQRDASGAVRDP